MAGEGTGEGTGTGAGTGQNGNDKPAWLAQMPVDLMSNEAFTGFKTIGDLGKSYLELKGKAGEIDGIQAQLQNAIIKPGEKATPEEIAAFHKSLGVPEKPADYAFEKTEGIDHDPKMIEWAQNTFHAAHLSKDQAAVIGKAWDGFVQGMVQAQETESTKALETAMTKLKEEWKADFDKNMEFTKRGWKKFTDTEFDAFCDESGVGNHPALIKFIFKVGRAMGEDFSLPGSQGPPKKPQVGMNYTTMDAFK